MKRHTLFAILGLFACLPLLSTCAADKTARQGFGLRSYAAELRTSDIRDGTELSTGTLFVAHDTVRYEMQGSGPLEQMVLLAKLDSGQAQLVNPANNACIEGSFTPRDWIDIGYLLEAFPQVAHPRIIASSEELLGKEMLHGYQVNKFRRTGKAMLFGEEKNFTEYFWLAEESPITLRHENDMVRSELTKIREKAPVDSLVTFPAECRKVSSFAELLQ